MTDSWAGQDLWKAWHNPSTKKRKKSNRGKQRHVWYSNMQANKMDDDEDEEPGYHEPRAPLWKGNGKWDDWSSDRHGSHQGKWAWAWIKT